jgi:hypothetical protein
MVALALPLLPAAAAVIVAASSAALPPALEVRLPMAYIQSSFVTGHRLGVPSAHGTINPTLDASQRLEQLRHYASHNTSFRGGEMFIKTMETPEALQDVREMNSLILQVANETGTPPFYGFWIPSRLHARNVVGGQLHKTAGLVACQGLDEQRQPVDALPDRGQPRHKHPQPTRD